MLASFQGRPQELSPKARYHLMMAKLFPNYYACVLLPPPQERRPS